MDMNKAFMLRKEDRDPQWHVVDASGKILGRLCSEITALLRGKDKVSYTPHTDNGDYVVVINAAKVVMTGKKMTDKTYYHYTGWRSGQKERTAKQLFAKDPTEIVHLAVRGMMPKESSMSRKMLTRLKIYEGDTHPHSAHIKK